MLYAVGDIHGYSDQLEQALALIEADGGTDAQIVFLGDYTDRGPDSRAVLQCLIDGQAEGRHWTCLLGNHDRMFSRFLDDATQHDERILSHKPWLNPSLGGNTTLASYGLTDIDDRDPVDLFEEARDKVPASHKAFLSSLKTYHETADHIFVHAGIAPGVAMADQTEDDLLWIREPFLSDARDHGKLIVHGHTANTQPEAYSNRINLDGGTGYGHPLVPAVFDGSDWHLLTPSGRRPFWSRTAFAA